jgi:hypothetical protein
MQAGRDLLKNAKRGPILQSPGFGEQMGHFRLKHPFNKKDVHIIEPEMQPFADAIRQKG